MNAWKRQWSVATAAVALAVGAGSLTTADASAPSATTNLSGTVSCTSGQPVEGVWVESGAGGSRWAGWHAFPGRPGDALYSADITFGGTGSWTKLHVGCGNNPSNWRSTVTTGWVWMRPGTFTVNAVCDAALPGRREGGCSFPPKGLQTTDPTYLGDYGYCTYGAYRKWHDNLGYFPLIRGNAADMDENAARNGYRVTDVPSRRSLVVINSSAPPFGHVAWVDDVRWNGSTALVDITEMNGGRLTDAKLGITTLFGRYSTRTLTWDAKKIGDWRFIQAWN